MQKAEAEGLESKINSVSNVLSLRYLHSARKMGSRQLKVQACDWYKEDWASATNVLIDSILMHVKA